MNVITVNSVVYGTLRIASWTAGEKDERCDVRWLTCLRVRKGSTSKPHMMNPDKRMPLDLKVPARLK